MVRRTSILPVTVTVPEAFELALQHHRSGRLVEAETVYRQILKVEPGNADALHLLGVIAHQFARNEIAVDLLKRAISIQPGLAAAHDNLGTALRAMGRVGEAIAAHRRAVLLAPGSVEPHLNLGNALSASGRLDEALVAYQNAIALRSDYAAAHCNLAVVLRRKGFPAESVAACLRALALNPEHAESHHNLAAALTDLGRHDEALASCCRFAELRPDLPEAHSNHACAFREVGLLDKAIAACRHAIALRPSFAEAHNNLGLLLCETGQFGEAIDAYRQSIAITPDNPKAFTNLGNALLIQGLPDEAISAQWHAVGLLPESAEARSNLGSALHSSGRISEAIAAYHLAVSLKPGVARTHSNLGSALKDFGLIAESLASFRQACTLQPDFPEADSNLIYTLHFQPNAEPQTTFDEHRRWARHHAVPFEAEIQPHCNSRSPGRRLRIGYVSPDFREHSVAYFVSGILSCHDPGQVEVFCYAGVQRPDAVTARLRASVHHWRSILGMADANVAELIRQDQIDILVDLSGHTSNGRLLVFARKPSPVQVTCLGYPNTTGLDTMDFRFTDAFADPPGTSEHLNTETLIRLPKCAWCYQPFSETPATNAPPFGHTRHITFGCFNMFPKINADILGLWARILGVVPGSRLLLKNNSLGDAVTKERLHLEFERLGIERSRIETLAFTGTTWDHLATYHRVDIALDTFPYHGTTTTCEALWMGVPVVTLAGNTHASRVGGSLLNNVALPGLIGHTEEHYIANATSLARDPARLAELRATLRKRMIASPLMDAPRFARDIEAAYREMWRKWCVAAG